MELIADPLMHLVQNAVIHGIEPPAERQARGKEPEGRVALRVYPHGRFVLVEVEDDGCGLDVQRLKQQALALGLRSEDELTRLSDREALELIYLQGFSTAPGVTHAAGRGVGMDVVRTNLTRVGGESQIETQPGAGTRFVLKLPLTLVVSEALFVRVGTEVYALPIHAVQRIVQVAPAQIETGAGREMFRLGDELLELVRLEDVLGLEPGGAEPLRPVVALQVEGRQFGVAVDELLGIEEVVIKGLGEFLEGLSLYAGATVTGEGRVVLLLSPAALGRAGRGRELAAGSAGLPAEAPEAAAGVRPKILLVDDSLSVRKVLGRMLEKAGFEAVAAVDGEDALQKVREHEFDAVITDLEMPRINGFELIQDLRRRPATRHVPILVITTRAGEKHLGMARSLGATGYFSKPVNEAALVSLLRTAMSRARARA
jgi:chemosensory pili system protein ChpA (sensor histidine kinase/response regulator)